MKVTKAIIGKAFVQQSAFAYTGILEQNYVGDSSRLIDLHDRGEGMTYRLWVQVFDDTGVQLSIGVGDSL